MEIRPLATVALAAFTFWTCSSFAQGREAVLHKIELHPGQKPAVCIGPVTRQPDVQSVLATSECDRDWTVFTFVASGATEASAGAVQPVGMFVHDKTGLCIATRSDNPQAAATLVLDNCVPADAQRWIFSGTEIVNARSRQCIGASAGTGAQLPLVMGACTRQDSQAFSRTATIAHRTLAAAVMPGAVLRVAGDEKLYLVNAAGQPQAIAPEALEGCGQKADRIRDVLPQQVPGVPAQPVLLGVGGCLAQTHAGRLLQAGFHLFYVNKTGKKQAIEAARYRDCGFSDRDLVRVIPEVLEAIPSGDPMPKDSAACSAARAW